jgi:hypothetical protein
VNWLLFFNPPFLGLLGTGMSGNLFRLFNRPDAAPFVASPHAAGVNICQPELVRCSMLGIAGHPVLGNFDKAKRHQLTQGGADKAPADAVFNEMLIGDGELPVLFAGMVHVFDLDPVETSPCGKA